MKTFILSCLLLLCTLFSRGQHLKYYRSSNNNLVFKTTIELPNDSAESIYRKSQEYDLLNPIIRQDFPLLFKQAIAWCT